MSFTVDDKTYELLNLDAIGDMTLGEVEILEQVGGLNLGELDDVPVTVRLVVALVHVSMLRSDPTASLDAARRVKVSVLEQLAETVANKTGDDADPPSIALAASGLPDSAPISDSSHGKLSA